MVVGRTRASRVVPAGLGLSVVPSIATVDAASTRMAWLSDGSLSVGTTAAAGRLPLAADWPW
jgi:hypothetical protein